MEVVDQDQAKSSAIQNMVATSLNMDANALTRLLDVFNKIIHHGDDCASPSDDDNCINTKVKLDSQVDGNMKNSLDTFGRLRGDLDHDEASRHLNDCMKLFEQVLGNFHSGMLDAILEAKRVAKDDFGDAFCDKKKFPNHLRGKFKDYQMINLTDGNSNDVDMRKAANVYSTPSTPTSGKRKRDVNKKGEYTIKDVLQNGKEKSNVDEILDMRSFNSFHDEHDVDGFMAFKNSFKKRQFSTTDSTLFQDIASNIDNENEDLHLSTSMKDLLDSPRTCYSHNVGQFQNNSDSDNENYNLKDSGTTHILMPTHDLDSGSGTFSTALTRKDSTMDIDESPLSAFKIVCGDNTTAQSYILKKFRKNEEAFKSSSSLVKGSGMEGNKMDDEDSQKSNILYHQLSCNIQSQYRFYNNGGNTFSDIYLQDHNQKIQERVLSIIEGVDRDFMDTNFGVELSKRQKETDQTIEQFCLSTILLAHEAR